MNALSIIFERTPRRLRGAIHINLTKAALAAILYALLSGKPPVLDAHYDTVPAPAAHQLTHVHHHHKHHHQTSKH